MTMDMHKAYRRVHPYDGQLDDLKMLVKSIILRTAIRLYYIYRDSRRRIAAAKLIKSSRMMIYQQIWSFSLSVQHTASSHVAYPYLLKAH